MRNWSLGKRIALWVAVNVGFAALAIMWLMFAQPWAGNIFKVLLVPLALLATLVSLVKLAGYFMWEELPADLKDMISDNPEPALPQGITFTYDLLVLCLLAGYGEMFWAFVWLWQMGAEHCILRPVLSNLNELRSEWEADDE